MSLKEKLVSLYPELSTFDFASGVITLQNNSDGKGDYIKFWNHPSFARPTQEKLDAV
jgi:hypothetical protein